ncbi:LPS export ABC transporter periplasmic protein LptC [Simplicispira psychrophila]|uniref:LPS export ABC transporter periplasmic protein LptC n=1 Tax=Simplicispira psychrophila TaxID=80882 RepID=UPI000482EAE6|nr:LPS export ABC transporter periplasmic protein LptC [Simplicispira psychrophila]
MTSLARRGWEGVTLYLPVILMGLLALGTWWLVRNAPQAAAPTVVAAPRHEADYFMTDFSVKNFDASGRLQSEVQGDLARHFPDTDTLDIDQARMRSLAPNGRLTHATANRALTNADGSEVQLFGNAVVTRDAMVPAGGRALPRLEFRSEFLYIWPKTERVSSNQPVVITRGRDQFTADTMAYDNLEQVLQLRGKVRGMLMPGR